MSVMKFSKPESNNKGLTFVEVLLAIVLLAIIVTPLIQVIYTSMALNIKSREVTAATNCGQSLMEYFESQPPKKIKEKIDDKAMNTNITLDCIGYTGKLWKVTSSTADANHTVFLNSAVAQFNSYLAAFPGSTTPWIYIKTNDNQYYYLYNVNYEGYTFDVLVYYDAYTNDNSTSTGDYSCDNILIEVYKGGNLVHDKLASYNGSVVFED